MKSEEAIIEDFIGGRIITDETKELVTPLLEDIHSTLYRGIQLPINSIENGLIIEEWYGVGHWTLDYAIARNFSLELCPAEDYMESIAEERNISLDEACELFVPVVIRLNGIKKGLRTYELAERYESTKVYCKEQEISTFGLDTIVTENIKYEDDKGIFYMLEVLPLI